jgi:membrane protein implicated in regulation of membrane protease activity
MSDVVFPNAHGLLAELSSGFVTAYWIALIVGGGLLVLSLLAGTGNHDVDVDASAGADFHADADVSTGDVHADGAHGDLLHTDLAHGHGASAWNLSTCISVRFAVFFLAVFGAIGVVMTYMTSSSPRLVLALALAGGAIVGQAVHHLFRLIRRTSGDSAPQVTDYISKLARVTINIEPPQVGEVALQVRGAERHVPATARRPFTIGDEVVVVGYRAGVAEVVGRDEYEQKLRG